MKAVVSALEQSSGRGRARTFVQDLIIPQLYGKDVNEIWNVKNPAAVLNDILKREGKEEAEFRIIRQAGAETILSVFHVGVFSDKNLIAAGEICHSAQTMQVA